MDFLGRVHEIFPDLPIIAEDLGSITQDVKEVMAHFDIPGMRVLLFGFSGELSENVHLPHNLMKKSVFFTGTHDNNTIHGWFENDATEEEKSQISQYFGRKIPVRQLHWEFIRLAMMSIADIVIFSMQDILGLGEEARMNRPFINCHIKELNREFSQVILLEISEELNQNQHYLD
jgi:4-alpha-glucanotransferase